MNHFTLQYALTIGTIVLIPLLLWLGKKRNIRLLTYGVFAVLLIANLAAYFLLGRFPSYLYLAIITFLSFFLVKKKNL